MNLRIPIKELKAVLKLLSPAISAKSATLFLDTDKGLASASDGILGIEVRNPALVQNATADNPEAQGERIFLDANKLSSIAANFNDGEIWLTGDSATGVLLIAPGSSKYRMPVAQSGIRVEPPSDGQRFTIPAGQKFRDAVVKAASVLRGRGMFSAVRVLHDGAAASDGQRLLMVETGISAQADFRLIVPDLTVPAIGLLDGGEIAVCSSGNLLSFSAGGATVTVEQTTVKLPDFEKYIPKEFKMEATVKSGEMRDALRYVSPMLRDDDVAVRLVFGSGRLTLSTPDGAVVTELDAAPSDPFEQDEFSITLNHRHLRDFFALDEGDVVVRGNTPDSPIYMETVSDGDPKLKLLLAPIVTKA